MTGETRPQQVPLLDSPTGPACGYCGHTCNQVPGGSGTCDMIGEILADRAAYWAAPVVYVEAAS